MKFKANSVCLHFSLKPLNKKIPKNMFICLWKAAIQEYLQTLNYSCRNLNMYFITALIYAGELILLNTSRNLLLHSENLGKILIWNNLQIIYVGRQQIYWELHLRNYHNNLFLDWLHIIVKKKLMKTAILLVQNFPGMWRVGNR